jgi:bifunctional non-homologous end joining protein LigD
MKVSHRDLMHPMPAKLLPLGMDWLFELKYDGFRCLALKDGRQVRLLSRRGREMAQSFPEVVAAILALRGTVAIDGERVVMHNGLPDFERLARRALTRLPIAVARAQQRDTAVFCAFDLLWRAKDQRRRPLLERKAGLQELLHEAPPGIVYIDHVHAGAETYAFAVAKGLEGIVAKRAGSPYVGRRSHDWRKIKTAAGQE